MARQWFGAGASDFAWQAAGGGTVTVPVAPAAVSMWSAITGGTQYTDLLSATGSAITSVTTNADGSLPLFQGPDGVAVMWAAAGGTERVKMYGDPSGVYVPQDLSRKAAVGSLPAVTGRAPVPGATDAHANRILTDFQAWIGWLNGAPGFVGECGVPARGTDVGEWAALFESYLKQFDTVPAPHPWLSVWGTEFLDADVPMDTTYGPYYSDNKLNRMALYKHIPAGGNLLGPVGRLSLASSVFEHHLSARTVNRYGVMIDAGLNGWVGQVMGTTTLGRATPYNPGPTHDTTATGGLTAQLLEYNYGTLVAPPGTLTTPQFLASRGVTFVRLAFRWERVQPTLSGALSTTELARLDAAIAAYQAVGISVILDCHNFGIYFVSDTPGSTSNTLGDSTVTQAAFVDFWTKMATHYVGMPGVLGYGLMNEPAIVATAAAWQTYSQAAFAAITAIDTATTVLVATGGGGDFSSLTHTGSSHPGGPWITGDTHGLARYESHHYFDYVGHIYSGAYSDNVGLAQSLGYAPLVPRRGETIGTKVANPGTGVIPNSTTVNSWAAITGAPTVTITVPASRAIRVLLGGCFRVSASSIAAASGLAGLVGLDNGSSLTPLGSVCKTVRFYTNATPASPVPYEQYLFEFELTAVATAGAQLTLRPIWNLATLGTVSGQAIQAVIGSLSGYTGPIQAPMTIEAFAL